MKILLFVPLLVWMLMASKRSDIGLLYYNGGCILWFLIAVAVWRLG